MITKGFITNKLQDGRYTVQCPAFNETLNAETLKSSSNLTISKHPGMKSSLAIGDVVFIKYENDSRVLPVIVGSLMKKDHSRSNTTVSSNSAEVKNYCVLPRNTEIGNIKYSNISCLSGIRDNIQESIDSLTNDFNTIENNIIKFNDSISELKEKFNNIGVSLDSNTDTLNSINASLGNPDSTLSSTLYGVANKSKELLENIAYSIGEVSDGYTISNELDSISLDALKLSGTTPSTKTVSYNTDTMLGRAEFMISVPWTPKNNVKKWNSSNIFEAGKTYYGIPYSLFSGAYKFNDWQKLAESNYSKTEFVPNYGMRTGPAYGSCCADFVSEVLGLPNIIRGVGPLEQSKYLKKFSSSESYFKNVKPGDSLTAKGHVVWVGAVNNDTVTIYEQTPPSARKIDVSIKNNSNGGYFYWGGEIYDTILRPTDELLSISNNSSLQQSYSSDTEKPQWVIPQQATSSIKNKKQFKNNALLAWKKLKENGWTAESAAGMLATTWGDSGCNPSYYISSTDSGGILSFKNMKKSKEIPSIAYYCGTILKDYNKIWDPYTQLDYLDYICTINSTYKIFSKKLKSNYWVYSIPESCKAPRNDFNISVFKQLSVNSTNTTSTICAKIWLERFNGVDLSIFTGDKDQFLKYIEKRVEMADILYEYFIKEG